MMNMFRKFWQRLETMVCAALFMICLTSCFTVTAEAASVDVKGEFQGRVFAQEWTGTSWTRAGIISLPSFYETDDFDMPVQGAFNNVVTKCEDVQLYGEWAGFTFGLSEFYVEAPAGTNGFYGDVGLYLNWFVRLDEINGILPAGQFTTHDTPLYFKVIDASGREIDSGEVDYTFYDVNGVYDATKGVACSIKFEAPEEIPAVKIVFDGQDFGKVGWLATNKNFKFKGDFNFIVPSATLIANVSSAELEALEGISNSIMEQNKITQDNFTEVIKKVDALYTEIGDLKKVQEEANKQFDDWNEVTVIPPVVSDKTDKADQVMEDINSLVKPDPEQIVPSLDTDTGDISSILEPFFSNVLIVQLCTMVLGFAFVSYVLFGKKG